MPDSMQIVGLFVAGGLFAVARFAFARHAHNEDLRREEAEREALLHGRPAPRPIAEEIDKIDWSGLPIVVRRPYDHAWPMTNLEKTQAVGK